MSAVAIASLRLSNPDARIVVVVDELGLDPDSRAMEEIDRLADKVIVEKPDFPTGILRSRWIKVNLRRIMSGDFVYLDSDTVVLGDLADLWTIDGDVAAAPDLDPRGRIGGLPPAFEKDFTTLGWPLPALPYLNTGVVLMRDRPAVHVLGERLIAEWRRFQSVTGRPNDQPVFNHVVQAADVGVVGLSLRYNAQIMSNPWTARRARIAHVFSSGLAHRSDTILHLATRRLKQNGVLDESLILAAQAAGHVWTTLDTPRKAMAAGAYGRGAMLRLRRAVRGR